MHIDIMTAMAATTALLIILGCQFLFFWSRDRGSKWLPWFMTPYALGAVGTAILTWRWPYGDYLAVAVGPGMVILAFGLIWQGARVFDSRPVMLWPIFSIVGCWLALGAWPDFAANLPLRVGIMSLADALFCGLAAFEFWRGRAEQLPSRLPAAAIVLGYGALMLVRVGLLDVAPYPLGGQPLDAWAVGIFNLLAFALLAGLAALLISLTRERSEGVQRTFALTDPLTGMFNRRAFQAQSERIIYRAGFGREETSLLALDLDHFKAINDRFGHDVGDMVLVRFAELAEASLSASGTLYRMGGEEFCFVLPSTALAPAIDSAERIRRRFERSGLEIDGQVVKGTVSIGIATTSFAGFDLEVLRAAADAALYEAKARGRNRVVVAEATAIRRDPAEHVRALRAI